MVDTVESLREVDCRGDCAGWRASRVKTRRDLVREREEGGDSRVSRFKTMLRGDGSEGS